MPNRIIKESIKRSPEIDKLTWFEEVVFYRLIVTADDYGRLDGRPVVLKNDLFPTKDTITRKAVEDAIAKLVSVGLLVPYVDAESGMPYYYFAKWAKHQRMRDSKEKYPAPPQSAAIRGDLPQLAAESGLESESESNPNPNPNQNPTVSARAQAAAAPAFDSPAVYASSNLQHMSPHAFEELATFQQDLPDDVIIHGIDAACDQGVRTWAYVRSILNRYVSAGYKSVGDVKAAEQKRKQASTANSGQIPEYRDFDWDSNPL